MNPRLTKRQQETYQFIREFIDRFGIGPTYREICDHLKLSSIGTVQEILPYLEKAGLIRRIPKVNRGIELVNVDTNPRVIDVELLGYVAAGVPIERLIAQESVAVPSFMVPAGGEYFALRVKGDSMRDENILDGDTLVCLSTAIAKDGDKVIALIDETAATVKKFYRAKNAIKLQPANRRYKALVISPPERVRVQGRVAALLRQYV